MPHISNHCHKASYLSSNSTNFNQQYLNNNSQTIATDINFNSQNLSKLPYYPGSFNFNAAPANNKKLSNASKNVSSLVRRNRDNSDIGTFIVNNFSTSSIVNEHEASNTGNLLNSLNEVRRRYMSQNSGGSTLKTGNVETNYSTRRQILNMNANAVENSSYRAKISATLVQTQNIPSTTTERKLSQGKTSLENEVLQTHNSFLSNYGTTGRPGYNQLQRYKYIFTDSSQYKQQ